MNNENQNKVNNQSGQASSNNDTGTNNNGGMRPRSGIYANVV